ncbi:acetylcholine receptor subunit beta isoform X1 [Nilaparvata lugens]|uniref:acetylcholine receptor subunit beta isoform X1 n=1 Tax=Nilaparvata lugens TaxID=108931 RepID=UPI00193E055D|nr:acetylcholine receptor subunit beta isoform X1 [Nilaparvata lugens]
MYSGANSNEATSAIANRGSVPPGYDIVDWFSALKLGFPLVKLQKNAPSKEKRLQADLFRDYDPFLSPNPGNRTEVRTGILLGNYEYMEGSSEMAIQGFIKMSWFDERLVWNVSETGVTGFVPEQDIWRPHLVEIKNRGFDGEPIYHTHGKKERNFNSEIQSTIVRNGDITSVHTIRLTAKCVADLKEWPRDRATCEAFIGAQAIQNINLTSFHDEYIFSSYMESEMEDWMLTNISEKKLDLKTPQNGFDQILSITLELQTTGNILTRLLIYPG